MVPIISYRNSHRILIRGTLSATNTAMMFRNPYRTPFSESSQTSPRGPVWPETAAANTRPFDEVGASGFRFGV